MVGAMVSLRPSTTDEVDKLLAADEDSCHQCRTVSKVCPLAPL
jgi:NAD-dependent dihydropyrimidine dehydrogenase PreA subunit